MQFSEIILHNLRHRKTRTMLTAIGLAVAVAAIASLWNITWGYAKSASAYYDSRDVDIVVVRAGVSDRLTSNLQSTLAPTLLALPGVKSIDGALTEMVSLGESNLLGTPLRGFSTDGFMLAHLDIVTGQMLTSSDHNAVLLGNGMAASLGKQAGQEIEIEGTSYRIQGVFQSTNPFEANCIVAPLADVQSLMDRQGIVSEFQVQVDQSVRSDDALLGLCKSIESLRDGQGDELGLKAQATHQFVATTTEAVLGDAMAWGTSAIVIALSVIGMLNTMLMSVVERTRELGLLRAVGWTRTRIIRMILGESVVISLVAGVIGLASAELLMRLLSQYSDMSSFVPTHLSASASTVASIAAVLAGMFGAILPALRAANVPPVAALRYE